MSSQSLESPARPGRLRVSSRTADPSADQTTLPAAPGESADPRRWRALGVTQFAAFMSLLDVSIVNVALPSMERGLGASAGTVQWVVSGYALAFALALVPAGRLGDIFGRRRMFLVALSAFVTMSAIAGAAPTIGLLIAARLLQGIAGGMLTPQNSGLIQQMFSGDERGRAFGILGATVGLATAAGPLIGGVLLALFAGPEGWRWVFYVNVPIGLITLVFAARVVPRASSSRPRSTHLDLVGSLLLGGAMLCLLLPVVKAEDGGLTRLWYLYATAVLLLLVVFARWERRTVRRGRQPLLDPGLVHTAGYVAGSGIGLVYFSGFTGIWLVFALFFQDGLGYSPLHSGLAVTPMALGVAASAVVAGRLVPRIGRWLTVCGLSAMAFGLIATAIALRNVGGNAAEWAIAGPLLVAGLGGGMVTAPNITLTLASVPVHMAGAAGGALQTAQRIGGAIGTAVLALIFYSRLGANGHDYSAAVSDAVLVASAMMLLALVMAIAELLRRRSHRLVEPAPVPRPEHHLHHI